MTDTQNRKDKNISKKKHLNGWKWAFLLLAAMVIGFLVWISVQLTATEEKLTEPELSQQVPSNNLFFNVRSGKDQLELLANQYLTKEIATEQMTYHIVMDEQVQLIGTLDIFGIGVPFELDLDPYVMDDGNLQLKATALSLGNLKLPLSFVMKQMEKQLTLPEWVSIHPNSEYLIVHLDEFTLKSGVHFSMEYLNLSEDDIRVNVYVPYENN